MDLSAVIFVVLALAWAVYLIPKALQHHDEVAAERLDESHSEHARVVTRRRRTEEVVVVEEAFDEPAPSRRRLSVPRLRRTPRERPELTALGRAARNRRRVLGGLVLVLAAVWGFTWFAYLPSWAPAIPTVAVVGWLVLARVSVVRMQRRESARRLRTLVEEPVAEEVTTESPVVEEVAPSSRMVEEVAQQPSRDPLPSFSSALADRPEVVTEQQALADDGSLWDPLPLTLPTYVGKATARRTVRTIELTGMTSSGHDESDSVLARDAAATGAGSDASGEQERKVVGG